MNEQEVCELFFERLQHLSAEAEYELRHPDYVMEMPQSGERIRGRDSMRAFQEAYPNPPTITPRRVVGSGDVWVIEGRSDYGDGQIYHVAMIVEFRDGKIWRDTRYYAEPFQAPDWRAQWVEPRTPPAWVATEGVRVPWQAPSIRKCADGPLGVTAPGSVSPGP